MGLKAWQTPPAYFCQRWELHKFTVDAAASESNALVTPCREPYCARPGWSPAPCCDLHIWTEPESNLAAGRYYTPETDGLKAEHYTADDRVWCNPPYDASLIRWVRLARELSQDAGVLWDMLLPPSIETRWFQRYIWNDDGGHWRDGVEAHFLPYRLAFIDPEHPEKVSPRAGNLQVTFWPKGVKP